MSFNSLWIFARLYGLHTVALCPFPYNCCVDAQELSSEPNTEAPERPTNGGDTATLAPPIGEQIPPLISPDVPAASETKPPKAFTPLSPLAPKPLAAVVAVGFLGNLALRTNLVSLASFVAVVALGAVLIRHRLVTTRAAKALLGAAVLSAVWLPMRTSPWLAPLNFLSVVGFFTAAVAVGQIDFWQLHPRHLGTLVRRCVRAVRGPELLVRSGVDLVRSRAATAGGSTGAGSGKAIVRGVFLALIPLVPIVALLASADVVFASLLRTPGDVGSLLTHAVLTLVVATMAAGLFAVALGPESTSKASYRRPLGSTEATVVLSGLVLVFSVFACTQALTALGGAQHIIETANLTRADYAREGFFQLLAVSVITLGVLFGTRIFVQDSSRRANFRMTVLATVASLLAVVVVGVSLIRLSLYVDAFGLTMLRLYSMVFGVFLGAVFVLYVGHLLAPVARLWFVPTVGLVAWLFLMVLNAVNPEAVVTNWNISNQTTTSEFDARYATGLSSDTIPTLVDRLDELPSSPAGRIVEQLCWGQQSNESGSTGYGLLGWNRSNAKAAAAVATLACAQP